MHADLSESLRSTEMLGKIPHREKRLASRFDSRDGSPVRCVGWSNGSRFGFHPAPLPSPRFT
jgi:hypothetical protein